MLRSGRKEGSQPLAKPALHSGFTKDPPGTGLGCLTESWGNMSRKLNNPTTGEENRQLYLFGVLREAGMSAR